VIVPVVLTSVEASIQLAESMEARGYGSGPRTTIASRQMMRGDWWLVAASALAIGLFIASQVAGWAADWAPYPILSAPAVDARPVIACVLLFAPVWLWRSRT
jgi:energy-coupling factor transport system permease protein